MIQLLIAIAAGTLVALAFWSSNRHEPYSCWQPSDDPRPPPQKPAKPGKPLPSWPLAYRGKGIPDEKARSFARMCANLLPQVERIVLRDADAFAARSLEGETCAYYGAYTRRNGKRAHGCAAMRQPECLHHIYAFKPSHEVCPVYIRTNGLVQLQRAKLSPPRETDDGEWKDGIVT